MRDYKDIYEDLKTSDGTDSQLLLETIELMSRPDMETYTDSDTTLGLNILREGSR